MVRRWKWRPERTSPCLLRQGKPAGAEHMGQRTLERPERDEKRLVIDLVLHSQMFPAQIEVESGKVQLSYERNGNKYTKP